MDTSKVVMKSVAVFEAAKGTFLLLAGFGMLSLIHRNIRVIAAAVVGRLHLNPTHGFAGSFVEAAARVTDSRLWAMALIGIGYALLRFLEAYGLWFGKVWAEWLAVLSGGAFVPFEIYEVIERFTWIRISALIINLVVVAAMSAILLKKLKARSLARMAGQSVT